MEAAASSSTIPSVDARPVVLDLDHTLLRSNVLHELALSYLKSNPLRLFRVGVWLLRGRANLKRQLAQAVLLDVDALPVNEEVAAFAREQKAAGRKIVLATATDALIA